MRGDLCLFWLHQKQCSLPGTGRRNGSPIPRFGPEEGVSSKVPENQFSAGIHLNIVTLEPLFDLVPLRCLFEPMRCDFRTFNGAFGGNSEGTVREVFPLLGVPIRMKGRVLSKRRSR